MTVDKAIEILDQLPYQGEGVLDGKTVAALKLGIKALKLIVIYRREFDGRKFLLLPGETTD